MIDQQTQAHYRELSSGNTKSVDDVIFDKLYQIWGFNFFQSYSFWPFGKVISDR